MSKTHYFCTNHVLPCEFRHSMKIGIEYIKIMKSFSPWISVKDRLPKEGMPVLAYNTDGDRFLAEMLRFYDKPDVYEKWFFVPDNCGCCNIFNTSVTHWMPLPEGPESYAASQPEKE